MIDSVNSLDPILPALAAVASASERGSDDPAFIHILEALTGPPAAGSAPAETLVAAIEDATTIVPTGCKPTPGLLSDLQATAASILEGVGPQAKEDPVDGQTAAEIALALLSATVRISLPMTDGSPAGDTMGWAGAGDGSAGPAPGVPIASETPGGSSSWKPMGFQPQPVGQVTPEESSSGSTLREVRPGVQPAREPVTSIALDMPKSDATRREEPTDAVLNIDTIMSALGKTERAPAGNLVSPQGEHRMRNEAKESGESKSGVSLHTPVTPVTPPGPGLRPQAFEALPSGGLPVNLAMEGGLPPGVTKVPNGPGEANGALASDPSEAVGPSSGRAPVNLVVEAGQPDGVPAVRKGTGEADVALAPNSSAGAGRSSAIAFDKPLEARLASEDGSSKRESGPDTGPTLYTVHNTLVPTNGNIRMGAPDGPGAPPIGPSLVEQIAQRAHIFMAQGRAGLNIQLEPEELGKVRVYVGLGSEGLQVRLDAESGDTRGILQASLPQLREALERQGLKVDRFDLAFSAGAFSFGTPQDHGSQQPRMNDGQRSMPYYWEEHAASEPERTPNLQPSSSLVDYRI